MLTKDPEARTIVSLRLDDFPCIVEILPSAALAEGFKTVPLTFCMRSLSS